MNLKQMEVFVAVSENENFSKAANELFLSQPTVSAHISALEKELGVRLFDRNTKEVNLTEQGNRLYGYARQILNIQNKIKETFNKPQIYDEIRKKYVFLTQEEWVRQNFIQYLATELNYPKGLMAVEKGLKVNNLQRRTDIVIYNRVMKPQLIVECKSVDINVSQETLKPLCPVIRIFLFLKMFRSFIK